MKSGVLGSIFTWGERSALFDLANGPHGTPSRSSATSSARR